MRRDWTGKLLVSVTWSLLFFANYTTVTQIFGTWFQAVSEPRLKRRAWIPYLPYTPWGRLLFIVYEYLSCIALLCHMRAVFGDPGTTKAYVPAESPSGFASPQICKPCGCRWKPPRAHHCRKCKLCVFRMDHHCAWIDNCVGIMNQKYFILFLVYTAILCSYQVFLLLLSLGFCLWYPPIKFSTYTAVASVSVLVESVVFLYMTTDFLSEQLESLETNSTLVESHQHTHGTQRGFLSHVNDVFGKPSFYWLLPLRPVLHLEFTEPVFLDKAVADQLRIRQRRHQRHGGHSRAQQCLGDRHPTVRLRHHRGANRGQLNGALGADSTTFDVTKRNPFACKPPAVHPTQPLSRVSSFDVYHERGNFSDTGIDNGKTQSQAGSLLELSSYEDDDGHYSYKNVYIKPQSDIGVDLDDDARFIELKDLESAESETYSSSGDESLEESVVQPRRHSSWVLDSSRSAEETSVQNSSSPTSRHVSFFQLTQQDALT